MAFSLQKIVKAARPIDYLLVAIPAAVGAKIILGESLVVFVLAAVAVIPLAGRMGHATEALAHRTSAALGGFLNATLGNLAEIIIAIVALGKGPDYVPLVKASLTGGIIGNLLLIMGAAICAGSFRRERVQFNRTMASTGSLLMMTAVIAFLVPSLFSATHPDAAGRVDLHHLSLWISGVLMAVYGLSLWFSFRTHAHVLAVEGGDEWARPGDPPPDLHPPADPEGPPPPSMKRAVIDLDIASIGVIFMSEMLVGSVEVATHALGMSEVFVGVIIIAVVGNAAQHSSAIFCALRGNMDLGVNIPIESSKQLALFAAPLLVFIAAFMGVPLDLDFTTFEVLAVFLSVFITCEAVSNGETHWLEGALLLAVYVVFGIVFYFLH